VEIARTAGADVDEASAIKYMPREVIWGDVIEKGWRDGAFVCAFRFLVSLCTHLESNRTTRYRSLRYIISQHTIDGNWLSRWVY
jgi:hypothetical protein